ncbi:unnamed protein product [Ostreobium quekettii]|uniref:Uncharacterized protein n=1 Tax=Ostreobium quekettii TaxID=121088 RepID=A0A8S1J199_9CHLO|nr:unnamed protein product [Ostreobium quekettii]
MVDCRKANPNSAAPSGSLLLDLRRAEPVECREFFIVLWAWKVKNRSNITRTTVHFLHLLQALSECRRCDGLSQKRRLTLATNARAVTSHTFIHGAMRASVFVALVVSVTTPDLELCFVYIAHSGNAGYPRSGHLKLFINDM